MSDPQPAEAVKLIASLFSGDRRLLGDAVQTLSERYGRADFISAPAPFDYTDYYVKEFGGSLIRRFVAFERLIRPGSLPEIKQWTNALEGRLSAEGQRRVNIDPGYLAKAHLILATGKGYTHRPYLRNGIYADLTLIYRDKTFHPLPWTYPDYAGGEVIAMLSRIREKYLLQLKGKTTGGGLAAGMGTVPGEKF
ncbi:MAG: hypothetical protein A2X96_02975 [Syntrophobacterales bacterium GWC2_56_13]|nr:MAG: hypothetical protein A2X96_02975 [Syntrophobacterales bacterium GWC2_56_13]OHE20717.1 MAG: hypothetical protein A2X95_02130 [Syntrophobacterales bacterium GWF2_56_9]